MKKGLSLRMRLTLITSLLLIFLSVGFTLFNLYNVKVNLIDELGDSYELAPEEVDMVTQEGAIGWLSNNIITITYNSPFSVSSILFLISAIALGSGAMYVVSGIALQPAKSLAKDIRSVDRNTLSVRLEGYRSGDEIQSIADNFNGMMDRLEEAFEREARFSAAAAHELKTPLAVVKTNLEVLQMDSTPEYEEAMDTIAVVKKQNERMIAIVEDLMLLFRYGDLERGDVIRLDHLVEEAVLEHRLKAEEKKIEMKTILLPLEVKGNKSALLQVLSNLLSNALRYSDGGGRVEVTMEELPGRCSIVVADEGIGIGPEEAEHIFEPFYRGDPSRSRQAGGAGLGLSIAKSLAEHHGGTLAYEPREEKGSRFILTLPLQKIF